MKWGILLLLIAYMAVVTVWANHEAVNARCTDIEVSVDSRRWVADSLAAASLHTELARYPKRIIGERAEAINTLDIERYLSRFNAFESVSCLLTPDRKLKVVAVPLVPEIRVFEPTGKSYYINKDGKRMDANAKFFADVPVVQGHFDKDYPATSVLPVIRFVVNDHVLRPLIASVHVADSQNIYLIPRIGGHVVNFGDTSRLAEKRQALLTAYRSILPRKGWNLYDTISVKYRDQVICTRRDRVRHDKYAPELEETDLEEATLNGLETAREAAAPSPEETH